MARRVRLVAVEVEEGTDSSAADIAPLVSRDVFKARRERAWCEDGAR